MSYLRTFVRFWLDFIIGDAWEVALTETGENGFLRVEITDVGRDEPDWAEELVADLVDRVLD